VRKDHRKRQLAVLVDEDNYSRKYTDGDGKKQSCLEYAIHHKILMRTGNTKTQEHRPTYKGCRVSGNLKNYNYFVEWCRCQKGFNTEGWVLDKDILSGKDKIYSEDTCVFIPMCVNSFLTFSKRTNSTSVYAGVSWQKSYTKSGGKYIVSCAQLDGKNKTLGRTTCPKEGYKLYRKEKVRLARVLAQRYCGIVDDRVYEYLNNFEKHIDDLAIKDQNYKGEV